MNTKKLTHIAVFAAIVLLTTMVVSIPVPGTNGYIHLGDASIFLAGALLGPFGGALAGGIGSMLADILSGYAHWALPTLLIKSLMGAVVGVLLLRPSNKKRLLSEVIAMTASGAIMIVGYYIAAAILYGNWATPIASIPMNLVQFAAGLTIALMVLTGLKRVFR
ncbi:MAG: ECF transporter S component [Bacillota bacterium]|nr:ECF transporter S component [Bacillota bacterium]